MKIKIIVTAFSQEQLDSKPIIVKVFDSINEFKRKLELLSSYKELKEVNQAYVDERQKIVNELVERHNEKIKPEKTTQVPPDMVPELFRRLDEILETEHKMKKPLKFKQKEIEDSGINISEMLLIEEFILEK